ncbi:choice-of-anchor Q domain-containing protein [Cellulomonas sp. NPDC089187]|uniref:choice-of-anchor Q domain-containing protein n=1 Tax=Cellulomonas sp. NPDC089187 TaxID=3154970 RepID=UPI003426F333
MPRRLLPSTPQVTAALAGCALTMGAVTSFGLPVAAAAEPASVHSTPARTVGAQIPVTATATVGAVVTTESPSGPGSLLEAIQTTQGTGQAISIDAGVSRIELDDTMAITGDVTIIGQGADSTSIVGVPWSLDTTYSLTGQPGASISFSGVTLIDVSTDLRDLDAFTLTDVTIAGERLPSVNYFNVTGDLTLDRVTILPSVQVATGNVRNLIVRDSFVGSSLAAQGVVNDVLIENVVHDVSAYEFPGHIGAGTVGGNVTVTGLTQTDGTRLTFGNVEGDVTLTDVTIENSNLVDQSEGPNIGAKGAVTVTGLRMSGNFIAGISVNAMDGYAQNILTISDVELRRDPTLPISWSTGIVTSGYGRGGGSISDVQIQHVGTGISLDSPGGLYPGDDSAAQPLVFEDVSIESLTETTTTGLKVTGIGSPVELRRVTMTDLTQFASIAPRSMEAGAALTIADSTFTTQASGTPGIAVSGTPYTQLALTSSTVQNIGADVLRVATSTGSTSPVLTVDGSTLELGSGDASMAVASIAAGLDVRLTNSTLVAWDAGPATARFDAQADARIDYSTLVGGPVVAGAGAAALAIDASVLDAGVSSASGAPLTISRSALADTADQATAAGATLGSGNLYSVGEDDRLLSMLEDHGGPVPTLAPQPGSVLIDAAGDRTDVVTDQRGVNRPTSGTDIGAVEIDAGTLALTNATVTGGDTATLALTRTGLDVDTFPLSVTVDVPSGTAIEGVDYLAPATTVEFAPGQTSLELPVQTLAVAGDDTSLTVQAAAPSGEPATGTVTIQQGGPVTDPEPEPTPDPEPTPEPTPDPEPTPTDPGPTPPEHTIPGAGAGAGATPEGEGTAVTVSPEPTVRSGVLAVTGSGLGLGALAAVVLALGTGLAWLARRRRA